MKALIILLCSAFVLANYSYAGDLTWVKKTPVTSLFTGQYNVFENQRTVGEDTRIYNKLRGFVRLNYTRKMQSDRTHGYEWNLKVNFTYLVNGVSTAGSVTIKNESSGRIYEDYLEVPVPDAASGYSITITGVTANYMPLGGGASTAVPIPQTSTFIPDDIDLILELRSERVYNLNTAPVLEDISRVSFDPATFKLYWSYQQGAEEYDLEWVFVDRYSPEYAQITTQEPLPNELTGYTLPFELLEPTRVRVWGFNYQLDKTYPEGRLYFRVRAVSTFATQVDGISDDIRTGKWGYCVPGTQLNLCKYEITDLLEFEQNKTWQYGITYADDGKSVSTVTYYDGSNRGRQNLTYNTSDNVTLVGESKYDNEGRQTVNVIPGPVVGRNLLYQANFNLVDAPSNIFDEEEIESTATPIPPLNSQVSGSAKYFSKYNDFTSDLFRDAIPNAKGYVFSQTVFRNDGTGRVERVGGIGQDFQASGEHAVRTWYGSTNVSELKRLFGDNVDDVPQGYRKDMVEDANDQLSVTYYDKRGNTIATALAGKAPNSLHALDNTEEQISTPLNDNNVRMGNTIISEHTFLNEVPHSIIELDYGLQGSVNPFANQSVVVEGHTIQFETLCPDCIYQLDIEVRDQDGALVGSAVHETIQGGAPCATSLGYDGPVYTFELDDIGEYRIIKKLTLDVDAMAAAFQDQLNDQLATAYTDFLSQYMQNIDVTACYDDCESMCLQSVKLDYIQQHGEAEWANLTKSYITYLVEQCIATECDIDNHGTPAEPVMQVDVEDACKTQRERMIHQISPGGVFYDDHNSSFWNSMPSNISVGGLSKTDLQNPANYTEAIASLLLMYHREACMLQTGKCEQWMRLQNAGLFMTSEIMSATWGTGTIWTSPYATDPEIAAFGINAYLATRVNNYLTDHPITGGTPVINGVSCPAAGGSSATTGNLRDYVDFVGDRLAAAESCSGSPMTPSEVIELKKQLFSGIYQHIKWSLVKQLSPCPYFDDENAIYMIPDDQYSMNQVIEGVIGTPTSSYCHEKAVESLNSWMSSLSPSCLSSLGISFTPLVYGTPPAQAYMTNYDPNATNIDLPHLFYAYAVSTCLDPNASNSFGLFYDPDADNHPGLQPGEAQYDAILSLLAGAGCNYGPSGTAIPFEIDPPLFSYNTGGGVVTTNIFDLKSGLEQLINYTNPLFSPYYPQMFLNVFVPWANTEYRTVTVNNFNMSGIGVGNINYTISWDPRSPVILSRWFEHRVTYNITMNGCVYSGQLNFFSRHPAVSASQLAFLITGGNNNLPINVSYYFYANFGPNEAPILLRAHRGISKGCAPNSSSTYAIGFSPSGTVMDQLNSIEDNFQNDCIQSQLNQAEADAQVLFNQVVEQMWSNFYNKINECLNVTEQFHLNYTLKEYQYTLYYYDLAGNLVQTVPPQGVHPLTQGEVSTCLGNLTHDSDFPRHDMETRYVYNGLNALIASYTPDAGKTDLYLDKLYRVRFSQNAQQLANSKASYNKYDALGRVVEAGEFRKQSTEDLAQKADIATFPFERIMDYTHTFYEEGYYPPTASTQIYPASTAYDGLLAAQFGTNGQQNLRNAVGAVMHRQAEYREDAAGTPYLDANNELILLDGTNVLTVISYSYDPRKNVKQQVSSNYHLASIGMQHKKTEYQYDLISGNVEEVKYQRGLPDGYRHRYQYDANNRLVRSFTSHNGDFWELDAKYFYYLHGPLARKELGHDQVQGTDYAYNLQGWLKGVNSSTLDRTRDIGKDGNTGSDNRFFGEDSYGFNLGYFENDYRAIRDVAEPIDNPLNDYFAATAAVTNYNQNGDPGLTGPLSMASLYNGNITHMVTALRDHQEAKLDILANNYQYDQLQRIREMKVYAAANLQTSNDFTGALLYRSSVGNGTESAFQENYTFDKNGNLLTLKRNGSGVYDNGTTTPTLEMDNLVYNYYTHSGGTVTSPTTKNQLAYVQDNVTGNQVSGDPYSGDLASGQTGTNYKYNLIGQLSQDLDPDKKIDRIQWTVTGKVKSVSYLSSSDHGMKFFYDPLDRRVAKMEYMNPLHTEVKWTYYSYDASGNQLAVYSRTRVFVNTTESVNNYVDSYSILDHTIYGADRLGVEQENAALFSEKYTQPSSFSKDVEVALGWSQVFPPRGTPLPDYTQRVVGDKRYELSNHLGNVLEVITDRKLAPSSVPVVTPTLTGLTGVSVTSSVITRTVTGTGWGTSGGASVETLSQGDQVEWTLGGTGSADNQFSIVGLSYTNPDNGYTSVKYGWYTNNAGLTILESGVLPSGQTYGYHGAYAPGDVLKIVRDNGLIIYYHNGNFKHASVDPQPNTPMIVDFAFFEYNRSIYGLKIAKNAAVQMYTADVVSYSDYSPYGTLLGSRHGNDNTYRYGFQGQERDDEIKGAGNSLNYEYRMHDPRIGRFFAVDPLTSKYAYNSPYAFSENVVINAAELEGLEMINKFYYNYETKSFPKLADEKAIDNRLNTNVNMYIYGYPNGGVKRTVVKDWDKKKRVSVYGSIEPERLHSEFGDISISTPISADKTHYDSWEGHGPFMGGGVNMVTSLSLGGGFSLQQKRELYDGGGGESTQSKFQTKLTWSATGGQTGISFGFSGYWESQNYDQSDVQVVESYGVKYYMLYGKVGNQSLDFGYGFFKKDPKVAFMEGYFGVDLGTKPIIDLGFEIDITKYMNEGMSPNEIMTKVMPDIIKGFEMVKQKIDERFGSKTN